MEALETFQNEKLKELLENADWITEQVDKTMTAIQEDNEGFLNTKWLSDDVELMDHQVTGVNWLQALHARGLNGILADEMGLGKTLQVIAFFGELFASHGMRGPHLVVMPLSVISSWRSDIAKFLVDERCANVHVHHGAKDERERELSDWWKDARREIRKGKGRWKVAWVLTTYEMVIKDVHYLKRMEGWQYMVVDEAHRLKNKSGILFGALNKITTQHRLLLTGTPLHNNLNELWSLLSFMLPKIFNDVQQFNNWFNKPFDASPDNTDAISTLSPNRFIRGGGCFSSPKHSASSLVQGLNLSVSSLLSDSEKSTIIASLHRAIKPFLLRRLKSEVAPDLPAKFERIVYCPLSDIQVTIYKMFKELADKKETLKTSQYADFDDTLTLELRRMVKPLTSFQNMIMQLRKLCNHPYLILEDMKSIPDELYYSHLMTCSGKMMVLDRLLKQLLSSGSKILIFSQMTTSLSILESFLHQKSIDYFRLDGNTAQEDRLHYLHEFNLPKCKVPVFLLSTRAGGVGINLQAADAVILFDSDWNPQMDLQAISRTHRIGQSNKVLILRLISAGPNEVIQSVEQKIIERAHRKLLASRTVLAEGVFDMGGSGTGSGSDVTTSSDCSSVQLESPIKNSAKSRTMARSSSCNSSSSMNNADESNYCLEDEFNDCFDEANIDNDTGDWYIGLNYDSKTSMRSLFEGESDKNVKADQKGTLSSQSVMNLEADHFLSLYDSMDFSGEGIRQICRKQAEELPPLSSLGEDEPLVHHSMESVGPIDSTWRSWLGNGVKYNETELSEEEIKIAALGKRKPRVTALYEARNQEKLKEAELDELIGETEERPIFGKRPSRKSSANSPLKKSRQASSTDVDDDYVDDSKANDAVEFDSTKRSQTGRPITAVTSIGGRIANNYVYGDELEQNCSLKSKCNRMPSKQSKSDGVLYFPSEDVCVICGHAWVSDEGVAQYVSELPSDDNVVVVEDVKELMLICESCEGSYHLICTGMSCVPEDSWYCLWCSS